MKKYNVKNYIRCKEDVKLSIGRINTKAFVDYTPTELKDYIFTISRKHW